MQSVSTLHLFDVDVDELVVFVVFTVLFTEVELVVGWIISHFPSAIPKNSELLKQAWQE